MVTLYIVRHGNTLFNKLGRLQGWCDSPLLEEGILQAKALHESFKDIDFVAAYSSTSERARDTLDYILGDRNIKKYTTKKLREYSFGINEGSKGKDVLKDIKDFFHYDWTKDGGENPEILEKRLYEQLDEIVHTYKEGNVLIVIHGAAILGILDKLQPSIVDNIMNRKEPVIQNCSLTKLEYDNNQYKLIEYNNVTYRDNGLKLLQEL